MSGQAGLLSAQSRALATAEENETLRAALRESQAWDVSLTDVLPQNVLRKDLRGRFTFVNRRFCETAGMKPSDVIGKTDFDLYPREMAEKFQADDRRVLDAEVRRLLLEQRPVRPDREAHDLEPSRVRPDDVERLGADRTG